MWRAMSTFIRGQIRDRASFILLANFYGSDSIWGFLSSDSNMPSLNDRVWVDDYHALHGLQLHLAVMFSSPSFYPTSRIVILVSPPPFRNTFYLFILLVIPLSSPLTVVSFKHLCPFLRGGAPDNLNLLHSFITLGEHFSYIPLLSRFRSGGSRVHLLTPHRIVSYVIICMVMFADCYSLVLQPKEQNTFWWFMFL